MEKKRYFLELAYMGTNYHGWQIQDNALTVQELMQKSLFLICRFPIETIGSGRTDTGVHAKQQFLHFDAPAEKIKPDLLKKLNSLLPKDIAVYELKEVKPIAHARFDALWRSYEYHITIRKNPFERNLSWRCFYKLDKEKMDQAAQLLLEYTDFECFSKVKTDVKNFDCKIKAAYWEQIDHHLIFHITANRFLRGMVRAIVGTMVEIGTGKLDLVGFRRILENKNRSQAGAAAPPQGLYLSQVTYPDTIFV